MNRRFITRTYTGSGGGTVLNALRAVAARLGQAAGVLVLAALAGPTFADDELIQAATAPGLSSDAPHAAVVAADSDQDSTLTAFEMHASTEIAASEADAAATCTCEKCLALKKAVAGAHKGVFYDNKFNYLCDPCYDGWALGDRLKRMAIGDSVLLDIGGQYRLRGQFERDMRNGSFGGKPTGGLTGLDDDFLLQRTRVYANTEIGERVRVYAEMLDAQSAYQQRASRPTEVNRFEMQNLFVDVVMLEDSCGKLTGRVGRQELLYGAQRLLSPLDWANTRRTFDGGKLMWSGQNWDVDAFWVRPLKRDNVALDYPNLDREMYGIYSTYKGLGKDTLDLYWLEVDWHDAPRPGFDYDLLGGRYNGNLEPWMYELEGGVQFGKNSDKSDHSAGFFTLGLGRKLQAWDWNPTLWSYYDWASGDAVRGNGFHQYEPLGHKYLGFMDFYGRRNIEDINLQLTLQPTERLKLLAWYHYFLLQNSRDMPYNLDMTPYANLPSGTAHSRDLGHEIDLTATVTLTARASMLFGYSHFFAGDFYKTTPGVPFKGDADFVYTEFTLNF